MKLIATDIANLTDARYFAARGAHMIGFNTQLSSPDEVNAMKEWVDVPAFFLELPSDASNEDIWEWHDRTDISCFLIEQISEDQMNLFPKAEWIYRVATPENIPLLDVNYLFVPWHLKSQWVENRPFDLNLPVYLEWNEPRSGHDINTHFSGVVLSGSAEDKTGVKSYDAIDDFIDTLDIEY